MSVELIEVWSLDPNFDLFDKFLTSFLFFFWVCLELFIYNELCYWHNKRLKCYSVIFLYPFFFHQKEKKKKIEVLNMECLWWFGKYVMFRETFNALLRTKTFSILLRLFFIDHRKYLPFICIFSSNQTLENVKNVFCQNKLRENEICIIQFMGCKYHSTYQEIQKCFMWKQSVNEILWNA